MDEVDEDQARLRQPSSPAPPSCCVFALRSAVNVQTLLAIAVYLVVAADSCGHSPSHFLGGKKKDTKECNS